MLILPSTNQAVQEEVEGGVESEEEMVEVGDAQPHRGNVVPQGNQFIPKFCLTKVKIKTDPKKILILLYTDYTY